MNSIELMKSRHSVRHFLNKGIEKEKREILNSLAIEINKKSDLNIQIVYDDKECFNSIFSKFARFKNYNNYIVIAGNTSLEDLQEKVGYYGEKLVLKAQEIGLNTCWVGLTHGKVRANISKDEKVVIVIALGYGINAGRPHKSKEICDVSNIKKNLPKWYEQGLEAALVAPTAMNQQKFMFKYNSNKVELLPLNGPYTLVDAGIVKYHFETISNREVEIKKSENI